jgi:D-glycero-D-manno-heptose 1,7-bisphosphate phosphatase
MRAIFLDRDGVICENRPDHVKSWEEFRFLPGAKNGLATLSKLGLPIVVVTNQAVINRGLASASVVDDMHQRMIAEVAAYGGRIDRVIYCPHRPEEQCACRKPEPGMLRQCAEEMKIDLTHSYLVGDAITDLMAGQRVGCKTFLVLTGRGIQQLMPALRSMGGGFTVTRNLMDAATQIFKAEVSVTHAADWRNPAQTEQSHQLLATTNRF